ncbi:ankyrin repeat family protein [Zea mays]|uniref:Ankyrin repeat family protein n=1 Tax=Zea mays TaxID=4577 RepID=A0A1D6KIC4_MAIZE|nr:ankyrin repeat family protein [Zea mays]
MVPPPRPPGGGIDKYDFYYWLGCQILALGNSIKLKLVEAIQDGDVRRLKGLVNSMKKKTREKLSDMNVDRMGLLQLAVHLGKLEVCRYFVEDLGFDVERGGSCDGVTPLGGASLFGEVACARFLLDHGADPNKMDSHCYVALHNAAKNGNGEIIRLLVSRGARVDIAAPHGTPLHIAASYGNTGAVKILLEHHADPNSISEVSGSPLVSALQPNKLVNESDSLESVKLLIKAGADVNSASPNTPLVVATVNGLTDCIKYLLEAGADANIPSNQSGQRPIQIASRLGRRDHVEILFPFTSPLRTMSDWSVEGIIAHEKSRSSLSKAIGLDSFDATLYSNRSLCYLKIGEAQKALLDAETCINNRPDWVKGYYRKGAALMLLKEHKRALDAFLDGLKVDPTSAEMEKAMRAALEAVKMESVAV